MPRRYKKKRTYRRRRRRGLVVQRTPVRTKMFTKMRYVANLVQDVAASGIATTNVYSCNGLYDPDITNVGHQPRGFDQLMALYDHYVVLGSRITLKVLPTSGFTNPVLVGLALKDGASTESTTFDYQESGYNRSTLLAPNATKPTVMTMNCSVKRFLGRSNVLSDPQLKGSSSSNPSEGVFFHVYNSSPSATNEGNLNYQVVIDYILALVEPKNPGQS